MESRAMRTRAVRFIQRLLRRADDALDRMLARAEVSRLAEGRRNYDASRAGTNVHMSPSARLESRGAVFNGSWPYKPCEVDESGLTRFAGLDASHKE